MMSQIHRLLTLATITVALLLNGLGCSPPRPSGKLLVLGIDGLDPQTIDLLMSEGRMPNFATLRQKGAYGRLLSAKPLLSPIIWTTIATGKPPSEHKIGHFVAVNQETGEQIPVTSQMRGVKALWNIMSEADKRVDVVGWWATWPAEDINGTVVSDHTCYHFLFDDGATGAEEMTGIISPPDRQTELLAMVRRPGDLGVDEVRPFAEVSAEELSRPFDFAEDLSHFKWALATANSYKAIAKRLWQSDRPDALLLYIEGVDSTSHLFGHLFRSTGLGGELAEQQQRYGMTVEKMYEFADRVVGEFLEIIDDDTTLVVLSDHGFQLGQLHDDPSKTRDMRRVSERFHRIEGILYMYGRGVKEHVRLESPALLDVAPTLLALAGLPPARDMSGRVLSEAFIDSVSLPRVASYEGGATDLASLSHQSAPVDPQILEHLKSLGYLDTASPTGERNLAAIHFENGRYQEAITEFQKIIKEKPEDGALRASLGGALGAVGRYDEALVALAEAERLSPLNPEIYHNRGVIYERQGKRDKAIAQYRSALRYGSGYEPSRSALLRLTGKASVGGPSNDAETLAATMAERAGDQARRGNYDEAMATLDQAQRIAPGYALVYQYRSNVAFLSGDRSGAIAALQRALELEPDNALYRQNLRYLQKQDPGDSATSDQPPTER